MNRRIYPSEHQNLIEAALKDKILLKKLRGSSCLLRVTSCNQ